MPEAILHKDGPLNREERAIMQRHTIVGEQILAPVEFLAGVRVLVRHEHERWDGAGYPDRLAGEEIPIGSRIILACDAYHAMTSDRPYREAMSHGVLAGNPVVDVGVRLFDGKHHSVDSSQVAFELAGSLAFRDAAESAPRTYTFDGEGAFNEQGKPFRGRMKRLHDCQKPRRLPSRKSIRPVSDCSSTARAKPPVPA